jgi:hypothetical protein
MELTYEFDQFSAFQLIILCIVIKHCIRLVFTKVDHELLLSRFWESLGTNQVSLEFSDKIALKERIFFATEHSVFTAWGYYVCFYLPTPARSWFVHPQLCWQYPPSFSSEAFHYFYIAKVGTHVEDLLYRLYEIYRKRSAAIVAEANMRSSLKSSQSNTPSVVDALMMDIHHIATAMLCILSYASGKRNNCEECYKN